jgi:hypothetical protein
MRVFAVALVLSFFIVSGLTAGRAPQRVVTGTVVAVTGEWLSLENEVTGPGFQLALRGTAFYGGGTEAIRPGARVRVRYRGVGDPRPLADDVQILPDAAAR